MGKGIENININTTNFSNLNPNSQTSELFSDIINGRTIQASQKISMGLNPNVVNQDGVHLLVFALKSGDINLVKTMLNSNTIDLCTIKDENGNSVFEVAKNIPEMGNILEKYDSNFSDNDLVLPLALEARNYYFQIMQAGLLWNAISSEGMLQNVDSIALFITLKEAIHDILEMYSQDSQNSSTDNDYSKTVLEDNEITVEQTGNSQSSVPVLEKDSIKECLIKILLDHLQNELNNLLNIESKADFLMQTLKNLESLNQVNISTSQLPEQSEEKELAFVYNPGLKTSWS